MKYNNGFECISNKIRRICYKSLKIIQKVQENNVW